MESFKVNIDTKALKALQKLAGKGDMRYYINGVHVRAGEDYTLLEATNGTVVGIKRTKIGHGIPGIGEQRFIIPPEAIDAIKVKSPVIEITATKKEGENYPTLEIRDCGAVYTFKAMDGIFPDVRRVLPATLKEYSDHPVYFGNFVTALIMDFQKVLKSKQNWTIVPVSKSIGVVLGIEEDYFVCCAPLNMFAVLNKKETDTALAELNGLMAMMENSPIPQKQAA